MPHDDEERSLRNPRLSTIATPVAVHDMVTVAYDDWDAPWQVNKTVVSVSPGMPEASEEV